jgi:hypothetical protein
LKWSAGHASERLEQRRTTPQRLSQLEKPFSVNSKHKQDSAN